MSSVNKVIILGRLGKDPEVRYMPSGDAMASLTVATSEKWRDKVSGETKEETTWHRIVLFGRTAQVAEQYLKKGHLAYFEGSIRTRKFTDKDGVEKFATDIKAEKMQLLGGNQDQQAAPRPQQHAQPQPKPQQRPAPDFSDMDEDLPF